MIRRIFFIFCVCAWIPLWVSGQSLEDAFAIMATADSCSKAGEHGQALALYQQAADKFDEENADEIFWRGQLFYDMAEEHMYFGQAEELLSCLEQCIDACAVADSLLRRQNTGWASFANIWSLQANALNWETTVLPVVKGDSPETRQAVLRCHQQAVALADSVSLQKTASEEEKQLTGQWIIRMHQEAGNFCLQRSQHVAEGIGYFRKAYEFSERYLGKWTPEWADCALTWGFIMLGGGGTLEEIQRLANELYHHYKTLPEGKTDLFTQVLQLKLAIASDTGDANAEAYIQEYLTLVAELYGKDSPNYIDALSTAALHSENGETKLRCLREEKEIFARLYGEKEVQYADILKDLGHGYSFVGEQVAHIDSALYCFRTGMKILEDLGQEGTKLYADMLNGMSSLYKYRLMDPMTADSLKQVELDIRYRLLDKNAPGWMLQARDFAYNCITDNPDKALEVFQEVLDATEDMPAGFAARLNAYFTRVGMKHTYTAKKDFRAALSCCLKNAEESLQLTKDSLTNPYYSRALTDIASCYSSLFEWDKAVVYYERGLSLMQTSLTNVWASYNDAQKEVDADTYLWETTHLEELYQALGCPEKAIQYWENILDFLDTHPEVKYGGNTPRYSMTLLKLGDLNALQDTSGTVQEGKAYPYYQKALTETETHLGKQSQEYTEVLTRLGKLYEKKAELANAEQIYLEALSIQEALWGEMHPNYLMALSHVVNIYDEFCLKDDAKFFSYLEKEYGLTCSLYGETHSESMYLLAEIYRNYFNRGNYAKAITWGKKAEKLLPTIPAERCLDDWKDVYEVLMASYYYQGDMEQAAAYCPAFYDGYVPLLKKHLAHAQEDVISPSELAKQAMILDIVQKTNASGTDLAGTAYNMSLLFKGSALKASIELEQVIRESGDSTLMADYALYEQIEQMRRATPLEETGKQLSYWEMSMQVDSRVIERAQEYGFDTRFLDLTWQDIQQNLDDKSIAIEFETRPLGKNDVQYLALAIRKDWQNPRLITLFRKSNLDTLSLGNIHFRQALVSDSGKDELYNSPILGQIVWEALLPNLEGIERIYFSPAGVFHQLAIEYLPLPSGNQMFSERFQVYRLSSTREILMASETPQTLHAVIYGGLRYDVNSQMLREQQAKYDLLQEQQADTLIAEVARSLSRADLKASYLPQTKVEAEGVYAELSGNHIQADLYTGYEGIEETIKALSGKHTALLHIATHGFYFTEQEQETIPVLKAGSLNDKVEDQALQRSGLLFSGAMQALQGLELNEGAEDGILTAREVSRLDLRGLDMVVLSACQTGLGEITDQGVYGLQRGFKKAGAKTLLMSLWSVDDKATQIMMTQFYMHLLAGNSKRDAFSKALSFLKNYEYETEEEVEDHSQVPVFDPVLQVNVYPKKKVIVKKNFRSPRYWAAFIMLD